MPKKLTVKIVTLTPKIAAAILKRDPKRRHEVKSHVTRLAKDIKAGKWQFTGDTVLISEDGIIIDGIHRLLAVCKAHKSVKIVLVTGIVVP